jgi:hypothetical protein
VRVPLTNGAEFVYTGRSATPLRRLLLSYLPFRPTASTESRRVGGVSPRRPGTKGDEWVGGPPCSPVQVNHQLNCCQNRVCLSRTFWSPVGARVRSTEALGSAPRKLGLTLFLPPHPSPQLCLFLRPFISTSFRMRSSISFVALASVLSSVMAQGQSRFPGC